MNSHLEEHKSDVTNEPTPNKQSRRKFLSTTGIGAGAAVLTSSPNIVSALGHRTNKRDSSTNHTKVSKRSRRDKSSLRRATPKRNSRPDQFTRLFEPNPTDHDQRQCMVDALVELSRRGGLLDANDPLEVGPTRLITEPELSPRNPDNPTHTAGTTFIGQFLDHDITQEAGSQLGRPSDVSRSVNLRTARFDLDSIYGGGPKKSPDLYEKDQLHFVVESGGQYEDLPREMDGTAIIGDARNDENLVISGLHVAFLRFHNAVIDQVLATRLDDKAAMREAQHIVRWHYQWMIIHEWLPQFVGQQMVDEVMTRGPKFFNPSKPQIPVEFQTAAYRFGHSMVRPSYRANISGDNGQAFFGFVFDPDTYGDDDPDDLTGGHRAPRRFIDWQTFFDFDDGEVKPNKRIDTAISTPMFRLPLSAIDTGRGQKIGPTSLPTRNLLRHLTWQIPTGQQIASQMGVPMLTPSDLAPFGNFGANLDSETPLWLYTLGEAELIADGLHLGPVAGRIVAEVFIGLLRMDKTSYLTAEPLWRPTLPSRFGDHQFTMVDMLTVAGVDPTSRASCDKNGN